MNFKPLDPDIARKLIKGQPDVIGPAAEMDKKIYEEAYCPVCHEQGCYKQPIPPKMVTGPDGFPVLTSNPFGKNNMVKGYACCRNCGTVFDPRTGVIAESPPVMIHEPHSDPHQV